MSYTSFVSEMPKINVSSIELSVHEKEIVEAILAKQGKNKGALRTAKPNDSLLNGDVAYVWRMVAFTISPLRVHHCMPVTADFSIKYASFPNSEERRNHIKELDKLVDKIVASVPKDQWHGVQRWHRAMMG